MKCPRKCIDRQAASDSLQNSVMKATPVQKQPMLVQQRSYRLLLMKHAAIEVSRNWGQHKSSSGYL